MSIIHSKQQLESTLSDQPGQLLCKLDMAQCGLVFQTWRDMVDWQFICLVGISLAPSNWDSEHNIENTGFSQFLLTHCICSFSRKDSSLGGWPGRYDIQCTIYTSLWTTVNMHVTNNYHGVGTPIMWARVRMGHSYALLMWDNPLLESIPGSENFGLEYLMPLFWIPRTLARMFTFV